MDCLDIEDPRDPRQGEIAQWVSRAAALRTCVLSSHVFVHRTIPRWPRSLLSFGKGTRTGPCAILTAMAHSLVPIGVSKQAGIWAIWAPWAHACQRASHASSLTSHAC